MRFAPIPPLVMREKPEMGSHSSLMAKIVMRITAVKNCGIEMSVIVATPRMRSARRLSR